MSGTDLFGLVVISCSSRHREMNQSINQPTRASNRTTLLSELRAQRRRVSLRLAAAAEMGGLGFSLRKGVGKPMAAGGRTKELLLLRCVCYCLPGRSAGWLVEEGGGRRIREGSDGPGLQTLTHSLLRLLASPTIPRAHYIYIALPVRSLRCCQIISRFDFFP
jgi:hypothetical protein